MAHRVLILTNEAADAKILRDALSRAADGPFEIASEKTLAAGLERMQEGTIDALLVDLSLPDSSGLATFDRLHSAAPWVPIMTIAPLEDDAFAREAVARGSQGYLSKGSLASSLVPQALHSMIQRKALEESLYREKSRADTVLASIGDAVICTDRSAIVEYLNPAGESLTGWTDAEAKGRLVTEVLPLFNKITRRPEPNPIELALAKDRVMPLPPGTILIRRDGSELVIEDSAAPIRDQAGKTTGAVMVFHDVTATQAMNEKLTHQAQHDSLTDLPNRALLDDRIAQAIARAKRHGVPFAVLFLDLDRFKSVNDSLGHAFGDKLLQSVSRRLLTCVRGSDTVSRQGGDEFVLLLAEQKGSGEAASIAAKILAALTLPHWIDGHELITTTSIGISLYPEDGDNPEALIKSADTAMYHAKEKGRNNYQFYKDEMNLHLVERQQVESSLRRALEHQEFTLHYQAKVNLNTGMITGAEALLRWSHPEWGLVAPARFIPVAEATGLILPIGRWVLVEACMQAKRWLDVGLPLGAIAVNISAIQLRQEDFVSRVKAILHQTGLPARHLQLEITESVLMQDAAHNGTVLKQLKDIGVQWAVDDFGTGYSSLSYLTQFPIDVLKIDQSFVSSIEIGPHDGVIATAVIGMGNNLDLCVVAEGVETWAQVEFLRQRHCDEAQGFLFSHPVPADAFAKLLVAGPPLLAA